MNRRHFLSSLLAGVIAPAVLPGAGRHWVKSANSEILTRPRAILNPAWVNAPFEVTLLWEAGTPQELRVYDPYPQRFLDAACTKPVYPFLLV
jgi:hypothetical protein